MPRRNALMEFLQSASNAVASNVSGPVDMLGAGLRYVGVPVPQNALGSSQWMEQKGLTKPVPMGAARIAGETFGLTAPVAAAAKAPQIAAGINNTIDDWWKYNGQLGPVGTSNAIAWHGSPHKFDKFDSSKIGTGEGAQAYGHGLYLAEAPDVAGSYAQSVKANSSELVKRGAAHGLPEDVASNLAAALQSGKKFDPIIDGARAMVNDPLTSPAQRQAAQRLLDNEMAAYNAWSEWSKPGNLYKVDIPDEMIARMLDWDRPLSQQAPEVQKAFSKAQAKYGPLRANAPILDPTSPIDGQTAYRDLTNSLVDSQVRRGSTGAADKVTSDYLRQIGIPGIRYLDGNSRGAGAGTSNFVVFPGEEGALQILERNGNALQRLAK